MGLLLAALLPALAPCASAFEFPLTRSQRVQKVVEEGQALLQRGDYLSAAETCARALDIRSDWAPAYLCRGEARLKSGDPGASRDARKALDLDPRSGEALRILGMFEYEAGRYSSAVRNFDEALRRSKLKPDEVPTVYYFRAKAKLKLGDVDGALADSDKGMAVLIGISGNYADWSFYSLRAEARRRKGRTAEADEDEKRVLSLLEERLRRRPLEAPEILRMKAESHTLLRDYDAAAKDYADLLAKGAGEASDRVDRADALIGAERHQEAVEELSRVLERDPGNPRALKLRGYAGLYLGREKAAISDLDAYLRLRPKDASAYTYRAIARLNIKDFAGGLSDIEMSQALLPKEAASLEARKAYALSMLGRHSEALACASRVLASQPESYSARCAQARSSVKTGRCREASASLNWLVDRLPSSAEYLEMRADCRWEARDMAGSISDLERALALQSGFAAIAVRLALRHREYLDSFPAKASLPELLRSRRFLDRAVALWEPSPTLRLLRGRTLYEIALRTPPPQAGRLLDEAKAECRAVLRKQPRNAAAKALLKKIASSGHLYR
jgi:tetratricopeptide (TPR) repeat protein